MPRYTEIVYVKDRPFNRNIRVYIDAPEGVNVTNLEELAQRCWDSPLKKITVGKVTVRAEKLKRG